MTVVAKAVYSQLTSVAQHVGLHAPTLLLALFTGVVYDVIACKAINGRER